MFLLVILYVSNFFVLLLLFWFKISIDAHWYIPGNIAYGIILVDTGQNQTYWL